MNGRSSNAGFVSAGSRYTSRLVVLLLLICGCSGDISTEVTIPNSAVQTGLDAWMPVVLNDYVEKDLPATATLEKTEIIASDGSDRIGLKMYLKTVIYKPDANKVIETVEEEIANRAPTGLPGPPVGKPSIPEQEQERASSGEIVAEILGTVTARVGIRYDASTAKFYCQDAQAEEIDFENLPVELDEPIKRLCEAALNKYFAENSVYTLSSDDTTMQLAKLTLKNVTARDGKLVVEVGLP